MGRLGGCPACVRIVASSKGRSRLAGASAPLPGPIRRPLSNLPHSWFRYSTRESDVTSHDSDRPIRVLHVVPDLDGGGLQGGVVRIINGLPGDEFRHEVCCLHEAGRFVSKLGRPVNVHEMHAGWHDPRVSLRLARVIRHCRPHVVHARNWSTWPDAVVARILTRCRGLIFSLHGWDSDAPASSTRAFVCRRLARWTDHFCSVSGLAARQFSEETGLDPDRFEILPNGVDTTRFRPGGNRNETRRELGLGAESVVIGSVGRFEAVKDYDLLITGAAELIHRRGLACDVLLVGDGRRRAKLRQLASDLGIADRVHFLGWRDDVERLLHVMDVFAMTSRREGMCNAILEAMATGLPVVATAVGGNPEMITDGRHGRLVPPGDQAALVGALADLTCSPDIRREMGIRARHRVFRSFSLADSLRRYAMTYRDVFSRCRLPGAVLSGPTPSMRRRVQPALCLASPRAV